MMFDVVRLSKQCGSGYINTVRCLPTKSCACLACLAYHNEQTVVVVELVDRSRRITFVLIIGLIVHKVYDLLPWDG